MSRAGEEMILALSSLLNTDVVKTAAKKDDDKKEEKKEGKKDDKKPCKCGDKDCKECKDDKKEEKKKDEKKGKDKESAVLNVLNNLTKLAGELDNVGADEASGLVDEALKIIVDSIGKKKVTAEFDDHDFLQERQRLDRQREQEEEVGSPRESDPHWDEGSAEIDAPGMSINEVPNDTGEDKSFEEGDLGDFEKVVDLIGEENLDAFREYLESK